MAELAVIATIASTAVTAAGTIASGRAEADMALKQGMARQQAANFEAKQLDIKAKDERALGQREMLQARRQKNLALSRLQSVSAASGFSATDPTSLALGDEIAKYGTLQEQTALYGGESRANDLNLSAAAKRYSGAAEMSMASDYASARKTAAGYSAAGTILGGVSTMASRFGGMQSPTSAGRYTGFSPYQRPGGPLVTSRYG